MWWSYTTTNFGLIKVDLTGSFSGADLGVYTGTNVGELTLVASNAFGNPDGTGAVTFLGQPGTEYEIAVQGALKGNFPVAGSISLSVAELLPPQLSISLLTNTLARAKTRFLKLKQPAPVR